jgi:hypothetical protein
MMRIVIAPDKFKGLATEASSLLRRVGRQIARDRLGAGCLAVRTGS